MYLYRFDARFLGLFALLDRGLDTASHSHSAAIGERVGRYVHDYPIRAASLIVFVAALVSALRALLFGTLESVGAMGRAIVLAAAILGTRCTTSWPELRRTRAIRVLVAALEPPDPPENATGDGTETERRR